MNTQGTQPDWDQIAEKFDLWLPHLAPVGDELLAALGTQRGDRVLDLACGTGEPALSLAERMHGAVEIIAVDAAAGMVQTAEAKARAAGLTGISFRCMPAEAIDFEDAFFDRVVCRFGLMLFEDPQRAIRNVARVLRPGGRFAASVWSTPETMPTLLWAYEVFKDRLDEDLRPPLARATSLGGRGALDRLLDSAPFSEYTIEPRSFDYSFNSFEEYWALVEASDILKTQYDAIPDSEHQTIRDEVGRLARDFVKDGRLVVPHQYLLATAIK